MESVSNIDEEAKERQQLYFNFLLNNFNLRVLFVPTRFSKKLSFHSRPTI